ncbi:fluoride efflux transporter CrcB [Oxalicibacterium faecigallinarum]|uniref:Fluoride-specific ion channel FluC n=1 Tax=Oxalicibacterium faecigallinarum TaxID=573741 RepID=A0A8J3F1S1_9BURK|nr:fluoride efflux transporter CrcB [Oxalicibacterium faecigallinarum]GGI17662.1 putative fluoride ion transporter CrcB [Oxalicibacterium faecigallinarum]
MGWLAVGIGAALGAWLRWGLSVFLNALTPHVPLGTLLANLGGGYMVGIAVAFFAAQPDLSSEWRLFAITGFLGGLTTFSSFSAESVLLLQRGDYLWALGHTLLHLLGSILFCMAGFATYRALSA